MDTSRVLAEYIVRTGYEDLPPEVVEVTKQSILDTVGVILAATTLGESGVQGIVDLATEAGGPEESTILGFGRRASVFMAALANGAMAHQLDYDDCFDAGVVHPGAGTVPAALAIAERQGNVTGRDFIAAVALGADVICRLSLSLTRGSFDYGWARVGTFNKYGALAAAGKLLGLDETRMGHAFGIALNQAAMSNASSYAEGSDIRAIRDGFGAQAGILSTLLAAKGIAGDQDSLDGKYGLYDICFHGDSHPERVTEGLGKRFYGLDVSMKPWPCCRNIHGYLEAVLKIMKEEELSPHAVREVITVSGGTRKGYYDSMEERRRPRTSTDARFSLPFVLGVAIVRGDVLLEDFTARGRDNHEALAMADRVTYRFDEAFRRPGIEIGVVEIVTTGGARYGREVPYAYGHPKNPLSRQDLSKKFTDCASHSLKAFSSRKAEQVIETIGHLEEAKDMRDIAALLS